MRNCSQREVWEQHRGRTSRALYLWLSRSIPDANAYSTSTIAVSDNSNVVDSRIHVQEMNETKTLLLKFGQVQVSCSPHTLPGRDGVW